MEPKHQASRRWPRSDSAAPPADVARARITHVMSAEIISVAPAVEVAATAELAAERGVEHVLVVRGTELVGVLCSCDLWASTRSPVHLVMSSPPITIDSQATVAEAAARMLATGVGCLPVVHAGRVVGLVTRGDLARLDLYDLAANTCASCGGHHHVRRPAGYATAFCAVCLDSAAPGPGYDELGWGD